MLEPRRKNILINFSFIKYQEKLAWHGKSAKNCVVD